METTAVNNVIPNFFSVVETSNPPFSVVETSDPSFSVGETSYLNNDAILDFLDVSEINNSVEEKTILNSLEMMETNHEENIIDSHDLPSKKRKYRSMQQVLKKRAKYLGMKGHELRKMLENDALKFCQQYNLLASSAICCCGANMIISPNKGFSDGFDWRCRKGHKNAVTVRKGSWFESSRASLSELLWIIYMWVHEYSYISMLHESDVSNQAVQDWRNNCRDACQYILKNKTNSIGGSDKVVELFEAKFKDSQGSKKHKSKAGSEQWILFGIERFSTKSVFLSVPDKQSHTLCDIFDEYILSGTKVHSHLWNVYIDLSEDNFDYLTKEKLITFYDCNTKADILTFKRFQSVSEKPSPALNFWDVHEFCEFMYRKTLLFAPDAYFAFLKDVALVYGPEGGVIRKEQPTPKTEKKNIQ